MFRQKSSRQLGIIAFAGAVGGGDEAAEITVALPVFRQQGKVMTSLKGYLGTDNTPHIQGTGNLSKAHCSAQVIMVGDGKSPVTQFFCSQQHFLQRGGAVMKRIIAVAMAMWRAP